MFGRDVQGEHGHIVYLLVTGKHPIDQEVDESLRISYHPVGARRHGDEFPEPASPTPTVLHKSIGMNTTVLPVSMEKLVCCRWLGHPRASRLRVLTRGACRADQQRRRVPALLNAPPPGLGVDDRSTRPW